MRYSPKLNKLKIILVDISDIITSDDFTLLVVVLKLVDILLQPLHKLSIRHCLAVYADVFIILNIKDIAVCHICGEAVCITVIFNKP